MSSIMAVKELSMQPAVKFLLAVSDK